MPDEPRPDRIKVFRRADGKWDFHVVAPNGLITEGSMQGFERRVDVVEAAGRNHPGLVIEVEGDEAP